jgi:hypothetical protein
VLRSFSSSFCISPSARWLLLCCSCWWLRPREQ